MIYFIYFIDILVRMKPKSWKQSDFHKNSVNSIIIDNKKIGGKFLLFFPVIKIYRIFKFKIKNLFSKKKFFILFYNQSVKVDLSRQISNNLFLNKNMNEYYEQNLVIYEPIESMIVNKYSKNHKYFFDIGSHQGYFALIASKYSKYVHVFEPLSKFYKEINYHIKLNNIKNIFLHKKAIGNGEYIEYGNYLEIKKIKTIRLDEFLKNLNANGKIFMKIDIDGFEINLLDGFNSFLQQDIITILIDVYPKRIDENKCLKQIEKLIRVYDKNSYIINKNTNVSSRSFNDNLFVPLSNNNISLLKTKKISSLFFGKI